MKKLNSLSEFDNDDTSDLPLGDIPLAEAKPLSPRVPNLFPVVAHSGYRIAIVGEAPGQDEEAQLKPFVGMSGRFLDQILSKLGIVRPCCFIGNVCQYRPYKNDITNFDLDGPEITAGVKQLNEDLEKFKPNICLLLGKTALWWAKGVKNLSAWRGSVFLSNQGYKCIATYHPAAALRNYEFTPLIGFDARKCLREAATPIIKEPIRDIQINLTYEQLIAKFDEIILTKPTLSCDIEGGVACVSCIGFAVSCDRTFVLPFTKLDGTRTWTSEQEFEIWRRVSQVLADPDIKKIWQNGLYDRFVLQWSHSIIIRGNQDDTMLKFWECYCELEKSLGFQASILTDEPYYKFERKTQDQDTFYRYCGKDACITFEINEKLTKQLGVAQMEHYKFNHSLLNLLLYMELRGLRYNEQLSKERFIDVQNQIYLQQSMLDRVAEVAGAILLFDYTRTRHDILRDVQSILCYKRDPEQPKKADADSYYQIRSFLVDPIKAVEPLSTEEKAQIAVACELTMNIRSPKFKTFLYSEQFCNLPTQWKKDVKSGEMKPTTDYEALLKLTKAHDHPALGVSIYLSQLRTRAQSLSIPCYNGRMHWSVNLVGSETGRITTSKSMLYVSAKKRVGGNMQAVADDWDLEDEDNLLNQGLRDLYIADEGCYLGKCDLKGADGWSIGSYMAMLGDFTMLDDLKFGLKPAQILAYIVKFGAEKIQKHAHERYKLKELCNDIKKEDWEYFVSKQLIWGTAYLLGPRKGAELIFIQSEGKVNLTEKQVKEIQACVFLRYRLREWHSWMSSHLSKQTYPAKLLCPDGSLRKFFGRKDEILGEALAHVPQVVTTHAIKKAAFNLWTDPENRINGKLRIEPMHTVHDELVCQFRVEDLEFAKTKIKQWFNNEIVIAGQRVIIPYEGAFGTTWAMDSKSKIGIL